MTNNMAYDNTTKGKEEKLAEKTLKDTDLIATSEMKNNFVKNKMEKVQEKTDDWIDLNFFQKAKRLISLITVEPILAGYVMPSVLSALATQNLYLEKACRVNLAFDHHICDALTKRDTANYTFEEEAVQTLVASVAGWKTVLQSFLPCGILIFLGAYSDRVGQRKICMLLPIIGEFLTSIGLIVNTYFFYELPVEVAAVTEAIFPALTGGWFTMFMGVFSFIAEVTTEDQRTLRIGIVNLFYSLGVPVGAALSGILVRKIGLYGVFSLSASLYVLSFLYAFFRIKEVKRINTSVKPTNNCCEWLRDFFDTRYVKDTIMVAFKNGPNRRRLRVIMLVIVLCVVIGPIYGEMSVMYLFTRYRFNWNEVDFSMFSTYAMCTSLVAPLVEVFNGTSFIAMRSMVSKLVDKDELGKVNSFFGVAEAMMPLVYAPMYTTVYTATIKTFPGAFFLLGGGLTIPAVLIFLWLYLANKKFLAIETSNKDKEVNEEREKGRENKAFESDDQKHKVEAIPENPDSVAAQIEIGFTQSMVCTSKL